VLVEVHPDVAQVLSSSDRMYLEELEKRLQKRIVIKARGSFHIEDYEIRSPTEKAPIERATDMAREAEARRRKRRRRLGPPAEVEALLEEEETSAVNPESMAAGRIGGAGRDEDDAPGAEVTPEEVVAAAPPSPEDDDKPVASEQLEGAPKPEG